MNLLDLVIAALVVTAGFSGYRRGALLQLTTYGGLLGGLLVGALLAPRLVGFSDDPAAQAGIAVGTLLIAAGIGDLAGWLLGARFRAAAHESRLRRADSVAGSAVAVTAVLLAAWFVTLNLVNGPVPALAGQIRDSAVVRVLGEALPQPPTFLGEVRRFLNRFGFPEVFAGLPPAPSGPVREPTRAEANAAFRAASKSTVRIVGEACDTVQEGSGFTVGRSYVLTNAHVVAGVRSPRVQLQNAGGRTASTVLYDPDLDVAVLRVEDAPGPVLRLAASEVGRGATGAVIGYPGGGDLTGVRAAVHGTIDAVGRDIYGTSDVRRIVYELQATVRPGNSGGPFVLTDGEVAGVVFAASTTDPGIGYALTSQEVLPDVRRASGRTAPVSTGPCVR